MIITPLAGSHRTPFMVPQQWVSGAEELVENTQREKSDLGP
jgi:hypothetical protein